MESNKFRERIKSSPESRNPHAVATPLIEKEVIKYDD